MGHKPIPLSLESFVAYIILQARVNLETDLRLDVVAFVGNSASREQVSMRWDLRSEEAKDASAEDIRKVAAMANADFVLMVQGGVGT
jgi:hypothetical protein